ncbi:hypothetical protein DL764_004198 [Monosporascus ibericus]|uniref:DM13 domain-containing protein n=1 Tax=Monosporascus ibericus TaxID=155417 RepID=A0A4Q4TDS0_9PEZI|nr:hypothetical protein DL764_004198 [Monosporascus ibericus]
MQVGAAFTVLSAFATFVMAAEVGDTGVLNGLDAGLAGTVTVRDENTLEISGYTLEDASAPALYWWGATTEDLSSGWRIHTERVATTASDETITIPLDNGYTADEFSVVGLWCEEFALNFGQTTLETSDGSSPTETSDGSSSTTDSSTPSNSAAEKTITISLCALAATAIFAISTV